MKVLSIILTTLFLLSFLYRIVYIAVRVFATKKEHTADSGNRFAVMIAARNERSVIGQLIDSIKVQDYPSELIDIFVVADNCTDDTAAIAAAHGAKVYERFDTEHVSKGFALEFLYDKIRTEHADTAYDGYFVFDADNLLDKHYISAMNTVFSDDSEITVGYRTAKNFSDNWISAAYGFYFLYESEFANRPRSILGTSCFLSGTGCLFSQGFLDSHDGWHWTGLTEDLECTSDILCEGRRVSYCSEAVLYDEQPTEFGVSIRQRTRWVRGYLQAIAERFGTLAGCLFKKGGFAVFDFLMNFAPLVLFILNAVADIANMVIMLCSGAGIVAVLLHIITALGSIYAGLFTMSLFALIFEWKRIRCPAHKKILYSLLFPVFMYSYLIVYINIFSKQRGWEQMQHKSKVDISDMK